MRDAGELMFCRRHASWLSFGFIMVRCPHGASISSVEVFHFVASRCISSREQS